MAIKVTHDDVDHDAISRSRFAREVDVLSELRHPNIVRLADAGEVAGRFYFVTDFIDGQPLDVYLRRVEPTVSQTIDLFLGICDAVNAAHLRGVVHRDLKPSNIMVDQTGQPHVLDFGLAKLMGSGVEGTASADALTITGQFVGSMPWATPEQVAGESDKIDTRTDVYSLGVILYQALTQQFPYEVHGTPQSVIANIRHAQVDRSHFSSLSVKADLETIVLTCLSKDPERRYQTAGELARDLRRFLRHEPIIAKRQSKWYTFTLAVRRHRILAASLTATAIVVIAYAVTTTVLLQRAQVAERRADARANDARDKFRQSRDTIDFMVKEIMSELGAVGHVSAVRQMILEGAYKRLASLTQQDYTDPQLMPDLADMHGSMADIAQSLERIDNAQEHIDEAREHVDAALKLRRRIAEDTPGDLDAQVDLSIALVRVGDVAGAQGDATTRMNHYEQALAIDLRLVEIEPDNVRYLDNLGWSYDRLGRMASDNGDFSTAHAQYMEQNAICETLVAAHLDNSGKWNALRKNLENLCRTSLAIGQNEDATQYALSSLEATRTLLRLDPDKLTSKRVLGGSLSLVAVCFYRQERIGEAIEYSQKALTVAEELVAFDPEFRGHHAALALQLGRMALWARSERRFVDAETFARRELEVAEALQDQFGDYGERAVYMANGGLAESLRLQDRHEEAYPYQLRMAEIGKTIIDRGTDTGFVTAHVVSLVTSTPQALWAPEQALALAKQAVEQTGGNWPETYRALGLAYQAIGDTEQAITAFEQGLALLPDEVSTVRTSLEEALAECRNGEPLPSKILQDSR